MADSEVRPFPESNWRRVRSAFLYAWTAMLLVRFYFAATLPLLVDEAFYAWEGRLPAWAYSDLPGMTAWLTRVGAELCGRGELATRVPFLALGACIPWLVVSISARWFGAAAGFAAGLIALAMPLSGMLGTLAVPDVPLVFASLLCLDAISSLRSRFTWRAASFLAVALCVGAFSHYRFGLVIIAGLAGLAWDRRGRQLLAERRFWVPLAAGFLAWVPLLVWNVRHGGSGARFQLLDRNPWSFHADGAWWIAIQALLLTPALFALLIATFVETWRRRDEPDGPWALLCGVSTVSVLGLFVLGFFADSDRVSFHWPLAGWLVLSTAAPVIFSRWSKRLRVLTVAMLGLGSLTTVAFLTIASFPSTRAALAGTRVYPRDFAGWQELGTIAEREKLKNANRVVASDFAAGAQLSFALGRPDIFVLDSPLNRKHGRAEQLRSWGLLYDYESPPALRLVVNDSGTALKERLDAYHRLCGIFGALPSPRVYNIDHGRKRYLIFDIASGPKRRGCTTPALAQIDSPAPGATVGRHFQLGGWAFKDGTGLKRIELTVDDKVVGGVAYGDRAPHVIQYWRSSTDPNHPNVGFHANVVLGRLPPGKHWLGLRLHGRDGGVEAWPSHQIVVHP